MTGWREMALQIIAEQCPGAVDGRDVETVEIVESPPSPSEPGLSTLSTLSTRRSPFDLEERTVIVQEGAKVPAEWAEGFARLEALPAPHGVNAATWLAMIDAAGRFLDQWGSHAAALGWSASHLFGLDAEAPINRRDRRGAAFYLVGAEVLAITADAIAIRNGGRVQHIYRRPNPAAPAWEIEQ